MVVRKVMPWSLQRGIILKFDEALRRPGILREQRGRGACVVCAQQFWKHELKQLILFTDPGETELPKQDHVAPTEQERLCDLLGVARYLDRWRHINESDIAKAELIASSVMHPFLPHRVLLHRAALSDDLQQPQTVCTPCRRALLSKPLALPKHALANDLWMGRCPPGLMDIAEGTQRLLPMVRACVQVTVLQPATADRTQRQKGMIGNTIFVPQATPSQVCKVLPPPMEDVQEHLTFVLVDHEKRNLSTAPLLRAPRAEYEAAVRSLQERSLYYKDVEVRVERLLSEEGDPILLDCVLETDGGSALARRLSQTGPADAQGQDAGESEEEEQRDGAPVVEDAGILDGFLCCDNTVSYKQLFVFIDQNGMLVKLIRCYNFSKLT